MALFCFAAVGDYIAATDHALYTTLPASSAFVVKGISQAASYGGFGTGTKVYSLGLKINPYGAPNDSQVYDDRNDVAFGSEGYGTAQAKFCVRFKLVTDTNIEVNYLETLVYLDLNFVDGFEIQDINVIPRQSVRTANQVYEVEGYRCKYVSNGGDRSETVPLIDIELQQSLNQGEVLQICVRPTEDARLDGIKMRSIDSFQF